MWLVCSSSWFLTFTKPAVFQALPQTQPGSLTPDELYAVVAYLLAENGIVAKDFMIDRTTLPQVRMPGRDHFVPDDRRGGPGFK